MAAQPPISVLIVDDQPLQREGFRLVLEAQRGITVVGEAGDGAQALTFLRNNLVDVVLMDVRMPRVNGFTATARLQKDAKVRAQGEPPRVVLVTALDLDDFVSAASDAGAFTLLYKDAPVDVLVQSVRAAAKHHAAPTA